MKTTSYALLGSGKLARHLEFYLNSLDIPYVRWARRTHSLETLKETLRERTHVLLSVSDRALSEFTEHIQLGQTWVHFSGVAQIPGMTAAHPLMTFGQELQTAEWYRRIPFVIDSGTDFPTLLPGWPNPHYAIAPELRPLYHSLVALAGNSVFLLWKQIGDELEERLKLPRQLVAPFLHQVVDNALNHPDTALTGPVARQDWPTVRAHLQSLEPVPGLKSVYEQYLKTAQANGLEIPKDFL